MNARSLPLGRRDDARLLGVAVRTGELRDGSALDLPDWLTPGDVLVVNDAATLPASLRAGDVEVRLATQTADPLTWQAILLGAGSWRDDTDRRPAPPVLEVGEQLRFDDAFTARVVAVSTLSPRLVTLRFEVADAATLWALLFRHGRPIQYSYLADDMPLEAMQTAYAGRPWAVEMPSAGRPLSWRVLNALRARGVVIAALTHAAGPSASGDPRIDAALPLPERYELPASTVAAIAAARRRGGRVIAVGTSVVRALESSVRSDGSLVPGLRVTDLRLGPGSRRRVADGIITNMHTPGESHFELLQCFAPRSQLVETIEHARARGYRSHELGDISLIVPSLPALAAAA